MKKLFRLLIAVFCIFFALNALPADYAHAVESVFKQSFDILSEGVVVLSEYAHELTGFIPALTDENSSEISSGEGDGIPGNNQIADNRTEADSGPGGNPPGTDPGNHGADPGGGPGGVPIEQDASGNIIENSGSAPGDGNVPDAGGAEGAIGAEAVPQDGAGNTGDLPQDGAADTGDLPQDGTVSAEAVDQIQSYVRGPVSDEEIVYYYYTCISDEERLLYDAMLSLAMNEYNDGSYEESRLVSLDPSSEEFSVSYTRAFNALMYDHPELFWISMSKASYQCRYYVLPSFGGQYKVIFTLAFSDSSIEESGNSGLEARAKYSDEMAQLRSASDAILAQVDFTQSDAGIALQLHDLLLNCAWYNRDAGFDDYAHTAYGALVADSSGNAGGALCDGYSLAYVYLLERAGLTAAMISGNAGSSEEDLEKHAWNIVCLDNEWYEVDATWNDLDFDISPSEEGYELLMEALSNEEYMARIRHYMFNRTTAETRSFTPGEEYRYSSDNGWVSLLQPSVHIRFSESESAESRDYITPLAPEATGTYYTWNMLAGY